MWLPCYDSPTTERWVVGLSHCSSRIFKVYHHIEKSEFLISYHNYFQNVNNHSKVFNILNRFQSNLFGGLNTITSYPSPIRPQSEGSR